MYECAEINLFNNYNIKTVGRLNKTTNKHEFTFLEQYIFSE